MAVSDQTQRDLATAAAIPSSSEWLEGAATPCIRIDAVFPGPLSKRPAGLEDVLGRAWALMADTVTFYGGEPAFARSEGRKPRKSDIEQLAQIGAISQRSYDEEAAEIEERKADLVAQGITLEEDEWDDPYDFGSLYLGDAFPAHESANHIMLFCGAWRVSLSFSLDVFAQSPGEVMSIAETLMKSGVAETASFGFAMNRLDGWDSDFYQNHLLPPTRRFRLLNMTNASDLYVEPGGPGVIPVNSWYWIDSATAERNGVSMDSLRKLEGQVHAVEEAETGVLVKLYAEPSLGDVNHGADLDPAFALGEVLKPGLKQLQPNAIQLGEIADGWAWLMRFSEGKS